MLNRPSHVDGSTPHLWLPLETAQVNGVYPSMFSPSPAVPVEQTSPRWYLLCCPGAPRSVSLAHTTPARSCPIPVHPHAPFSPGQSHWKPLSQPPCQFGQMNVFVSFSVGCPAHVFKNGTVPAKTGLVFTHMHTCACTHIYTYTDIYTDIHAYIYSLALSAEGRAQRQLRIHTQGGVVPC